jgi:CRISPR/Cas system endoribonuclease Cas6 (RAMP superfamily)
MNSIFHRKTGKVIDRIDLIFVVFIEGIKKNSTKNKQISKDMISSPQSDFIHAFHLGISGKLKIFK